MKPYIKLYLDHYNLHGEYIPCVVCGATSVDIHHISPKGMGGRAGKDVIDNLIALCRLCHEKAHSSVLTKEYLRSLL
jgi:5-methylcytosine-specific restriction endonuclease McrA